MQFKIGNLNINQDALPIIDENEEATEEINAASSYNQSLDFGTSRTRHKQFDGFVPKAKSKFTKVTIKNIFQFR